MAACDHDSCCLCSHEQPEGIRTQQRRTLPPARISFSRLSAIFSPPWRVGAATAAFSRPSLSVLRRKCCCHRFSLRLPSDFELGCWSRYLLGMGNGNVECMWVVVPRRVLVRGANDKRHLLPFKLGRKPCVCLSSPPLSQAAINLSAASICGVHL